MELVIQERNNAATAFRESQTAWWPYGETVGSERVSDAPPPDDALSLLGDEYARAILIATRETPMTASALADELDAAPSTVYERIEDLEDAGFLSEMTRTDERGNHYAEYRTRLEQIGVTITGDGFELVANYRDYDEQAARLHALWSDLR